MQRLVEVKRRMRTIEDIRGVARTMATVASAKLSRTRQRAAGMRVYAERMRAILRRQQAYLADIGVPIEHVSPFFVTARPERVLLVHLAGDRGMCGNYNMSINRVARAFVEERRNEGVAVSVMTRGLKAEQYLRRKCPDLEFVEAENWPRAGVTDEIVDALHAAVTGAFLDGEADEVWCAYTRFYTPVRREPTLVRLLPVAFERTAAEEDAAERRALPLRLEVAPHEDPRLQRWAYEPSFSGIVDELIRTFVHIQCEDVLLEAYASEQGARMITMEEATERAGKRLYECKVLYNRLRREFITTDLLSVLFASHVRKRDEAQEQAERARDALV